MIEQTEALVSIDVNGGHGMFGQGNSQEKAILEVNLAAARQVCYTFWLLDYIIICQPFAAEILPLKSALVIIL